MSLYENQTQCELWGKGREHGIRSNGYHQYVQSKKNGTKDLISKREIDSQTQKTNFWLPKGKGDGGEINYEFGFNRYSQLYIFVK